ncbi:hypothetical protein BKA91DRAFT_160670 [Yarrowia lipolytica]|nr:hypothetical protein BKA91DRAFT_160670 [Yarrowia lipolytica]
MKNYYSVRVGHNPDIYEHLDVTQYQITEYPNAQWKGFNVYQHAEAYLGGSQMNIEPRVIKDKIFDDLVVAGIYATGSLIQECLSMQQAINQVGLNGYATTLRGSYRIPAT